MGSQPAFTLPSTQEKPSYVQRLFTRIARYYDLMNDLMSLGMHRLWKRQACQLLNLKPGDSVLDVCCGTGDLEFYLANQTESLDIVGLDFCEEMLAIGRKRACQKGINAQFIQGDALALPFGDNRFNGAVISYGLRNVADYRRCLTEMYRVLTPGSRIVILDMSHPQHWANLLSFFYRFTLMPLMGKVIAKDPDAYRYLSNSIYFYLSQQELASLMTEVGFQAVQYQNKLGGVCALHWGIKPSVIPTE